MKWGMEAVTALGVYGRKWAEPQTWLGRTTSPQGRFIARFCGPTGSVLPSFSSLGLIFNPSQVRYTEFCGGIHKKLSLLAGERKDEKRH